MLRVKNTSTHAVDAIAPGAEGTVPNNSAVRALIGGGVLELLAELAPPRTPKRDDGESAALSAQRESFDGAWKRAQSRIDELMTEGDALREQISLSGARVTELEGEVATLREQLAAVAPPSAPKGKAKGKTTTDDDAPTAPAKE